MANRYLPLKHLRTLNNSMPEILVSLMKPGADLTKEIKRLEKGYQLPKGSISQHFESRLGLSLPESLDKLADLAGTKKVHPSCLFNEFETNFQLEHQMAASLAEIEADLLHGKKWRQICHERGWDSESPGSRQAFSIAAYYVAGNKLVPEEYLSALLFEGYSSEILKRLNAGESSTTIANDCKIPVSHFRRLVPIYLGMDIVSLKPTPAKKSEPLKSRLGNPRRAKKSGRVTRFSPGKYHF